MPDAPAPDDLTSIKSWFRRLSEHVRSIDYEAARPIFAEDMLAFGTFDDFISGRDGAENEQWRNVWPYITDFHWRLDDVRAIVAPDRLRAVGIGVFDSTGYHEDGTPYHRPGRGTVVLSRKSVDDGWVAEHTHMSLFRDVPTRSFGKKEGD